MRFWAASSPFFVLGVFLIGLRMALTSGRAVDRILLWLFLCSLGLMASAVWLSKAFFQRPTKMTFGTGMVLIYLGWLWQRIAYMHFIPDHFLRYGYFQMPAGKSARLFLFQLPFESISALLAIACIVGFVTASRGGARWSLLALLMWWCAAFVLFAMPSLYLYLQGDAAIFI